MIKYLNEDGIYIIEDVFPVEMFLFKDYFSKLTKKYNVHFIEGKRPGNQYAGNNRLILIFKNNV